MTAVAVASAVVLIGAGARSLFDGSGSNDRVAPSGAVAPGPNRGATPSSDPAGELPSPSTFLDDYVDPDGRVVRRDQGNDTVSEGQAYGMLVAAAVGDSDRFDAIWTWTRDHLLQPNGLLAWHWQDGSVTDAQPATDADLDAAHALLLAASTFGEPSYRTSALELAAAVLENETVEVAGAPVLVAGPWARTPTPVVNPSYTSPIAYALLAEATGDPAWTTLATGGVRQWDQVTSGGSQLPPDWATVAADGTAAPSPSPAGRPPSYGYDGFRVIPRAAGSCDPAARRLAAELADESDVPADSAQFFGLDGSPSEDGSNPVLLVAAAAAAAAEGDAERSDELLVEAAAADRRTPAYYLSAWLALGQLFIDGTPLGGCAADPSTTTS